MLVIFEGADGSGKSCLIKKMLELNSSYVQVESPSRTSPTLVQDWERIKELSKTQTVLVDRSCLTELVYRSVLKDHSLNMSIAEILNSIDTPNTVIVYCESNTSFEDSMTRGEDYITDSDVHKLLQYNYGQLMELLSHRYPVIYYNRYLTHAYIIDKQVSHLRR